MNRLSIRFAMGTVCLALALGLFAAVPAARASEEGDAARTIFNKWRDAVITVKATVRMRMIVGGVERSKEDNEIETLATVIDPSGLAVLSFSCFDPSAAFDGILKQLKASGNGPQMDIDTSIAGITMVFPDGREIPAEVILKDPDLDMAFISPKEKPEAPILALDLSGEEGKHNVLDTICILGRLDKSAGRGPTISLHRIEAVIESPRKCYVVEDDALLGRLGAPVFSLDGKVVGFSLLKISKSNDAPKKVSFASSSMSSLGIMPVVLPTVEVVEIAKQAVEAKEE